MIAILQVQDDIQHLRAAAARAGEGELDLQALDMAISRTEKGINVCVHVVCVCERERERDYKLCHIYCISLQAVAERVMRASHSQVTTLPAVVHRGGGGGRTHTEGRTMQELITTTARRSPIKQARYKSFKIANHTVTTLCSSRVPLVSYPDPPPCYGFR